MIKNDEQLRATHEALGHLYRALASLRQDVLPKNARQYALFAEGPLEEIRKLQFEIDEYLGLTPAATHADALHEPSNPYDSSKT